MPRSRSYILTALFLVLALGSACGGEDDTESRPSTGGGAGNGGNGGAGLSGAGTTGGAGGATSGGMPSSTGGAGASGAGTSGSTAATGGTGGTGGNPSGGSTSGGSASGGTGAGSSGSAGSASAGTGGAGVSCASLPLCDDFEKATTGMAPDPTKWMKTKLSDCEGTAPSPTIDESQHHSGSKSLKVVGTDGYCGYSMVGNAAAVVAAGSTLHGRFWMRFEKALQDGHTGFAAFTDTALGGKALRMGGQNGALQWNRQTDDATLPAQSPVGISKSFKPPVGQWFCVQFAIDKNAGTISTSVNGSVVEGLVADGTKTPDVDDQWNNTPYKPAVTDFNIGWQNYGGGAMNLWFDDVALGSQPIACGS